MNKKTNITRYDVVPADVLYTRINWLDGDHTALVRELEKCLDKGEAVVDCRYRFVGNDLVSFSALTKKHIIKLITTPVGAELCQTKL